MTSLLMLVTLVRRKNFSRHNTTEGNKFESSRVRLPLSQSDRFGRYSATIIDDFPALPKNLAVLLMQIREINWGQ
jgi:hypothetical protein